MNPWTKLQVVARLLLASAALLGSAGAAAQVDCQSQAAACAATCSVSGAIDSLLGGGNRGTARAACRKNCEQQRAQCLQQTAGGSPAGTDAIPAPPRPDAPGTATRPPAPMAAEAAGGHVFTLRAMTTSPAIVPVQVPVHEGAVVVGLSAVYQAGRSKNVAYPHGDVEATRLFMLMHVAARPQILDDARSALELAQAFLPPQDWDDYIECSNARGCAQQFAFAVKHNERHGLKGVQGRIGLARDWKGGNEFERPRSHKAFVAKYGPILRAQAAALPQEVLLVTALDLPAYSAKDGGFPFGRDFAQSGPFYGASPQTLPIAPGYCAPTSVSWPSRLAASPQQAELLLRGLQAANTGGTRRGYLAARVRVNHIDAQRAVLLPSFAWASGECKSDAQLLGLTLHADETLAPTLHTFAAPGTVPQAASTKVNAAAQPSEPAVAAAITTGPVLLLNDDTLRLYIVRHKPNWRELLNLQEALRSRSRLEAAYYQRVYHDTWPTFDPAGPFLASDVAGRDRFSDAQVAAFGDWLQRRAAALPGKLVARFLADAQGPVIGTAIDLGYGQVASNFDVPGLKEGDMMRRVSGHLAALKLAPVANVMPLEFYFNDGRQVVRDVALVFPAPVRSYSMAVTETQRRAAGGSPRTELELRVDAVSFVPSGDGSEILVLRVAPTHLRLLGDRQRGVAAQVAL